jgi:hypothetical protein
MLIDGAAISAKSSQSLVAITSTGSMITSPMPTSTWNFTKVTVEPSLQGESRPTVRCGIQVHHGLAHPERKEVANVACARTLQVVEG